MFLLPPFLRRFFEKRQKDEGPRVFLRDAQLVHRVKEMAVGLSRKEQDLYQDIVKAGVKTLDGEDKYARVWDRLSKREQQVTALTCLGYRSYEIAGALSISYETVRTHSKHIYAKFGLNRKGLRLALKQWNFEEWREDRQV